MKSLITGITGFVGSHLAKLLLSKNNHVFGIYRWRSPLYNLEGIQSKVKLHECDLRDLSSIIKVLKLVRPKYIYHLAAQSYVPASFAEPKETMETNIIGTLNILEAVRHVGIDPVIQICSSSDVYGEIKKNEVPIRETNVLRPLSPYAVSKAAEDMLGYQYFKSYGLKTIITRAFNITGPGRGEVFAESSFAKQIVEIEKNMKPAVIFVGNLDSVRTYADVRDIARAYWLVLSKGKPGEIYNIAGDSTVTIKKVLDSLLSLSPVGSKIKIKVDKKLLRPSDSISKIPNDRKFRKMTGWRPEFTLEQSLSDLLDWWRARL